MEDVVGIAMGLAALGLFVAWIWFVIRAFKADGFGGGLLMLLVPAVLGAIGAMKLASLAAAILCVLSVPVLGFLHFKRNDGDGKTPLILAVPCSLAIMVVIVLSVLRVGGFGEPS